jgi:RNA polymerase sigma-70 factor (ECF subfamily)
LAIDAHRKRRYLVSPPFEVVCAAHADSAPPVEDVLASRERLRRVWEGLETLSERTREVFVMHRLEGRKYHEIAAALGISCSAVEKHMAKADLFLMRWVEGW